MSEPITETTTDRKPFYRRWWFIALAVLVGLGVVASLGEEPEGEAPTTTLAAADAPDTTVVSPATAPETTTVPPETTTAVEATTTTATTSTTVPESEAAFGDGTWLVGDDIAPGVYQTQSEVSFCYWERLSGLGGSFDEIIANANVSGQGIVEIKSGDEAFSARGCGDWVELVIPDQPLTTFADGWWAVGSQIVPGRYRASGGNSCYWERLAGFSGEFGDIITNGVGDGQVIVEINPGDAGFHTSGCGTFELVG